MPVQLAVERDPTAKKILFGYYAAFFLLLGSFLLTFYTYNRLSSYTTAVEKTNKIVRSLEGLFAEVKNAESANRGFLIIQDKSFLEPYNNSYTRADSILKELAAVVDSEVHGARLDTISRFLKERYATFESGLQSFYNYEPGDSIVQKIRRGKIITDELYVQLAAMETTERTFLKERAHKLEMYSKAALPVNLFTFVLAIILAVYSLITYNREKKIAMLANKERSEKEKQLEQNVLQLRKANEELVRFRRMEKFAATGRMARIIAHEVRNPLSNINLAVSQLKEESTFSEDEGSTMLIDIIVRNSERINQLVTDLLNATRIQEMNFSTESVNTLLEEALTAASDRTQLQNISVIKEYAPDTGKISADREKLKIAFLNIIVNAIEAMNAGAGVLRLKTERKNGKCMVIISDNGLGIDKDSLTKLFEPYFTNKPRGSGLGLANTQAIILTHKGSIEVDSEPGKGATFIVSFDCIEG